MSFRPISVLLAAHALFIAPVLAQEWELVWSDEFDYEGLPDDTKWDYDVGGHGWGNQESQYYTANREKNARVEDGMLIIEAHKEEYNGKPYTSARLVTRGVEDWTYGRIAVRARLPSGRGTWPAIWMLPTENPYGNGSWPDNGEIDIMEHVGYDPGQVHASIHTNKYNHLLGTQRGGTITVDDAEDEFHEYSLEWTPHQLDVFVDDTHYFQYLNDGEGWSSWPYDHPFHLLLNIAVGGTWGGAEGIDDSIFPQKFEFEWVRVYDRSVDPTVTMTISPAEPEEGVQLDLEAEVSDHPGEIDFVDFMQGGGVIERVFEPPYVHTIDDMPPGCFSISARVTDMRGRPVYSDTTDVSVGNDCAQASYVIAPHHIPGTVEAEWYDLGGGGTAYYDTDAANHGDGIRQDEGVDIQITNDTDGGHNVGWIESGEWLAYTIYVDRTGIYSVDARVASPGSGGSFSLLADGVNVTNTVSVPSTGGWQDFTTITIDDVELVGGIQELRFRVWGGGFNINRFAFHLETQTNIEEQEPRFGDSVEVWPNPFKDSARIGYDVPEPGTVVLTIYDVQGRLVTTLADHYHAAGRHYGEIRGVDLPAGVYFCRLQSARGVAVRPVLRLD